MNGKNIYLEVRLIEPQGNESGKYLAIYDQEDTFSISIAVCNNGRWFNENGFQVAIPDYIVNENSRVFQRYGPQATVDTGEPNIFMRIKNALNGR